MQKVRYYFFNKTLTDYALNFRFFSIDSVLSSTTRSKTTTSCNLRRCFFCRGSPLSAANSKSGVGLGLSLSKRLAKSIKAKLSYIPADGGGACFVIEG